MRAKLTLRCPDCSQSDQNTFEQREERTVERIWIDAASWLAPSTALLQLDHLVHTAEDEALVQGHDLELVLRGEQRDMQRAWPSVHTRYQRLWPHRNETSAGASFEQILQAHRTLHDRSKPLVRADYEHALDVWQWVLRLEPQASLALQTAALFHDIERLISEHSIRVEQHAADYVSFKRAHAARGAELLRTTLFALGSATIPSLSLERAVELVAHHEQPADDRELQLLNDADALSFFSLNASGFLAYYGAAHTEKKVRYTAARLSSAAARAELSAVRLEPYFEAALARVLGGQTMEVSSS